MKSFARLSVFSLAFVICLTAAPFHLHAQTQSSAEQVLVKKAEALTAMQQTNLAAQVWKQVLMVDPDNVQALEALARWEKYQGHDAQAQAYIERLGRLGVSPGTIAGINATASRKTQDRSLKQAAQQAKEGHPRQAMRIYRRVFGDHPPKDWAEAYYDTEAAVPSMHEDAIRGMRSLAASYPANDSYAINLGRELTYNPKTRMEGVRILEKHPENSQAREAWRQALLFSVRNPQYFPLIRAYLRNYPDEALAEALRQAERAAAQSSGTGLARTPAEQAAYAALSANHLKEAETRFETLHRAEPRNPRVLAGMGFVQMKLQNFAGAISFFSQAEQEGLPQHFVEQGLKDSRFWYAMQEGTQALNADQMQVAQKQYEQALQMRPGNAAALQGLAGTYMKAGEPGHAANLYQKLAKVQPNSPQVWREWFTAEVQAGDPAQAVQGTRQFPAKVLATLKNDPQFLESLANAYIQMGESDKARLVLSHASQLPGNEAVAMRLTSAGLQAKSGDYLGASQVYHEILQRDSSNLKAWQGLISIEQATGHDAHAIAVVEQMPPGVYDHALEDPDFLALLAGIYENQKQYGEAQNFLQRELNVYRLNHKPVPDQVQLQRASLALHMGHPERAWSIYRIILSANPGQLDAWQALLAGLHQRGRDADALAELRQIPLNVRARLEKRVSFQQTEAQIYAATGNAPLALGIVKRVQQHYLARNVEPPAGVEVQNAWLLYNTNSNRDLYRTLMNLGDRTDLNASERRQVQAIWASWAVKRAAREAETGDMRKALAILQATGRSFPGNPAVTRDLAAGYLKVGQPGTAMRLYGSLNPADASASDYQAMVGAALAANKKRQAERWLREGLQRYPNSPEVLTAAARFEQAKGDNPRAAAYWQAALRAMPQMSPATKLAHEMDQPQLSRLATSSGLAGLMRPESNVNRSNSIPLPGYRNPDPEVAANDSEEAYGPDPYYMGTAPVILSPRQRTVAVLPDGNGATADRKKAVAQILPDSSVELAQDTMPKSKTRLQASPAQGTSQRPATRSQYRELAQWRDAAHQSRTQFHSQSVQSDAPLPLQSKAVQPAPDLYYVRPASSGSGEDSETADVQSMPGASDSQLMQENLPPLRGPYARPVHPERKSPREVAQQALARIQDGYSGWFGGTAYVDHRSGNAGYDRLNIFDAPIEGSTPLGTAARLSLIVNPVFLDSGQATQIPVLDPAGDPVLLGSETSAPKTPPAQQNAAGVGGELQLTTKTFGVAAGYTPGTFLVANVTGRLRWNPSNGPFTFSFSREAVKDSQLSYAGLRDPASISSSYPGNIWGGVVANSFGLQYGKSTGNSGFYISGGGQYITGRHVETNHRINGDAGAYWQVWNAPEYGSLTVGANLFGMHYAHNLVHFTYGQGGYFSPQTYMLANIPLTWKGHYERQWHYRVDGGFGIQGFQEESSPYYPLDPSLEAKSKYLTYPSQTIVGANYNLAAQASYHIGGMWYVGGFTNLDNTRDYNNATAGFFVRFLFRPQHTTQQGPTGLFPYKGLRPFMIP